MDIVLRLSSLSYPSSSRDLFGRDAPLVAEIGVGSGGFISDLAERRSDLNVLGVDRAAQSIARSYRRIRHAGVAHARLIKGDAEWVVRNVVPAGGLDRAYVNFPDPWPRKKHHGRRLLQEPFLRLLSSRLRKDGDLLVTTDHEGYFEFVLRSADAVGCYEVRRTDPPAEVLDTKWARKASTYYHAVLRPFAPTATFPPDVKLADAMYHAVLEGELPDLSTFEKCTFRHRHAVVVLMDAYRSIRHAGFAFLVHVEEEGLSQEVIVEAREGSGGFVVALRRFGEPLHTRGVNAAVHVVVQWLLERGMNLIHKKY